MSLLAAGAAATRRRSSGGGGDVPTHGSEVDATNTGIAGLGLTEADLADGDSLDTTVTASGVTYEGYRFSGAQIGANGSYPTGMTFRGCLFETIGNPEGANVTDFGEDTVFEYCTFRPNIGSSTPQYVSYSQGHQYGINKVGQYQNGGEGMRASYCDFWGHGEAFQIATSFQAHPVVIEFCYMHHCADPVWNSLYHHDGILSNNGGSNIQYMTINGNRIVSVGNTQAIALQIDGGSPAYYSNITVTNNLCSGYAYTYNLGGDGSGNQNFVFTDNIYSTELQPDYGPLYGWSDGNGNLWRRNTWLVPAGAAYGDPADSGKFWHPNGTLSTTDYTG